MSNALFIPVSLSLSLQFVKLEDPGILRRHGQQWRLLSESTLFLCLISSLEVLLATPGHPSGTQGSDPIPYAVFV